jgi:hypothetical protein
LTTVKISIADTMAAVQTPVPLSGPPLEERRSDDYEEERLPPELLEAHQRIGLVLHLPLTNG